MIEPVESKQYLVVGDMEFAQLFSMEKEVTNKLRRFNFREGKSPMKINTSRIVTVSIVTLFMCSTIIPAQQPNDQAMNVRVALFISNQETAQSRDEETEHQIKQILIKTNQELSEETEFSYNYVDLNKDGINEIIVRDQSDSGNGWGLYFVFLTNPLRMVLKMDGDIDYKILKTSSKGFNDIEGWTRGGSTIPKTIYKTIYKWNGKNYFVARKK